MKKPTTNLIAALTVMLVVLLAFPLLSLLQAKIYGFAWAQTLAVQYGPGPTYQSWFGISTLTYLLVTLSLHRKLDRKAEKASAIETSDLTDALLNIVGVFVGQALVLGMVLLTCFALGW